MPQSSEERTVIGKIVGAHGVGGTMLLLPMTDYPERFLGMKELVLEFQGKPPMVFKVKVLSPYEGKNTFFLRLAGVDDRDKAETLKGALITVSREERVELSEDEYWIDDIVGLNVIEKSSGLVLGEIEEVMSTGSNDVYIVKTPCGHKKAIPALSEVINTVDVASGFMEVTLPEGLWD